MEDMDHVLAFFGTRSTDWSVLAKTSSGTDQAMQEGLAAYAREQSAMYAKMKSHCHQMWALVPQFVQMHGDAEVVPSEFDDSSNVTEF